MKQNYKYRLTHGNYVIREQDGAMLQADHPVYLNWLKDGNEPLPAKAEIVTADQNKSKAVSLLAETDWAEIPSVSDITNKTYLVNVDDFIEYRVKIRSILVNPKEGLLDWPVKPKANWS